MTAAEEAMAKILRGKYRWRYLQQVADLISPSVKAILDIGCGIGALIPLIRKRAPSSRIIGLDLSTYMLSHLVSKYSDSQVAVVQGIIPRFPFKEDSFDVIVSVQCLSEVYHFIGDDGLRESLTNISRLLRKDGMFVVMDHQSPGDMVVDVETTEETLEKIDYFKERFNPRQIQYDRAEDGRVSIGLRDIFDFVTKSWSFGTALEEEEMNESHTPFTREEYASLIVEAGLKVNTIDNIMSVRSHIKRHKIRITNKVAIPGRYVLLSAVK